MGLTYNEIMEQYDSLRKNTAYIDAQWDRGSPLLRGRITTLAVIGCGSSYSLAKSMATMARMHTGVPAVSLAAGDVLVHAERYAYMLDGATVVAVSRSGSTSEILLAVERLRELGCRISLLSICCVENSKLAALSDYTLELPWAFDHSVCQTRTVTCLYHAFAYCMAKAVNDEMMISQLQAVVDAGEAFAGRVENTVKELAAIPWTHGVVLGDAEIGGLAEEGALAFKEICQLPSNYYHMLDARHGPMVLFKEDTLILAVLGPGSDYELSFLKDMVKKGSTLVVFSDVPVEIEGAHVICFGQKLSHIAKGIPFILLCQLITYYKSFHSGSNPDAPTGLDAWISL